MRYIEGQIVSTFGQLLRAHAETVSGAYKQRKVFVGVEGGGERECTDAEKLDGMLKEMHSHNRILRDLCEHLPVDDKK